MFNPAIKGRVGLEALSTAGIGVSWHDGAWLVSDEVAAQQVLGALDAVAVLRQQAIAGIKTEAGRRIEAVAPEWRQRNMTARGLELLMLGMQRAFTADEAAEIVVIESVWISIKAVRAASNVIESAVGQMTDIGMLESLDVSAREEWPT